MKVTLKKILSLGVAILFLTGCSIDNTIEKGTDTLEKGNDLFEKGKEEISEVQTKVNKVTSFLDRDIAEVQNSKVYDEEITFKELIDNTVQNPIWSNEGEGDSYIVVSGKIELPASLQEQYPGLEEIALGFPFSDGMSLANADVFTTIDGFMKINGSGYEASGQEIISILEKINEQ